VAVISGQAELRLIRKEDQAPLASRPSMVCSTPLHSGLSMALSEQHTDSRTFGAEGYVVKATSNGLKTCVDASHSSQLLSQSGFSDVWTAKSRHHQVTVVLPGGDSWPS
jgi:hypothetical protein